MLLESRPVRRPSLLAQWPVACATNSARDFLHGSGRFPDSYVVDVVPISLSLGRGRQAAAFKVTITRGADSRFLFLRGGFSSQVSSTFRAEVAGSPGSGG